MNSRFGLTFFLEKFLPVFLLFLFLQIIIGSLTAYQLLIRLERSNLEKTAARVREDIVFNNGKWDLTLYNADNNLPDADPLYIISSDGFIIERSRPITGLLDLSRYSPLLAYSSPTTIETVTNENWRVLSVPLKSNEQSVGVVLVATYKPNNKDLQEVDKQIQDISREIISSVSVQGDSIDTSKLEVRKLPFNISFQVINRFNKVLLQSNNSNSVTRMPTSIDRSYIERQLRGSHEKQVEDTLAHKRYLTITEPLYDENNLVAGIIVVGSSLGSVYTSIITYSVALFIASLLLLIIILPLVRYYIIKIQRNMQAKSEIKLAPKVINFMKKTCRLLIDGHQTDIPYASFQYYFCTSLFFKPQKKWEADELLEAFGEEDFGTENWRKVYDTMVALNRKTSHLVDKLFMVKNKRYSINPQFLTLIRAMDT